MNVQIETTKYFSVERFQSFKSLENSTIIQGFSNPYIALIGRNPFRACFNKISAVIIHFLLRKKMPIGQSTKIHYVVTKIKLNC